MHILAQKKYDPKPDDVATANNLKESFEEEDIVILSKDVTVNFKKNSKQGLVEAITRQNTNYLNISTSAKLQHPVFYDTESTVSIFDLKSKNGRSVSNYSFKVYDQYVKDEDLFHTDYRVKYINLNFPLKGTRFEVETEKNYKDVKYYTSEYFTGKYRMQEGTLKVVIPKWLDLEIKEFNFDTAEISKDISENGEATTITYTYKNTEPQASESSTPGPSLLFPHVLFIAKSYTDNDTEHILFKDVNNLYAWYNSLVKNVAVDASVYKSKVDELIAGANNDEEKVKNIFYWVQDNIRYIAFEDGIAGFKPDSPQNVFTKRYGDCKGMAILTKSMLEAAGLESNLVWIGTDRLGYDYSIPSLSVDNHMICSVNLNGETIFLDGTEKYNRLGDYATRIQNKQALLQDGDSFKIITVPEAPSKTNTDKTHYKLSIENETLKGTVLRNYSGECRVEFQNIYTTFGSGDQQEVLSNYLTAGNKNTQVTTIQTFDVENRDKDLEIAYNVAIESAVSEFDGTIYIDIDPVKRSNNYIFEDRKLDYQSRMKRSTETKIALQIPSGYTVGELPQTVSISNKLLDIQVTYKAAGDQITYTKSIDFKQRRIPTDQFDLWNSAFMELKENLNQQITLVKQ